MAQGREDGGPGCLARAQWTRACQVSESRLSASSLIQARNTMCRFQLAFCALILVAWSAARGGLTATRAAVVQLAVPILAAAAGVLFLAEAISARLVLAAVRVLGGIAMALADRRSPVA